MTDGIADTLDHDPAWVADKALKAAAGFWFLVAVIGMWSFVYYLLAYYINPVLQGGLEALANTRLPNGYIPDDPIGNVAVGGHLFVAVTIIGFGPLQLIPWIRERFPTFHHWNGRVFLTTAVATSLAGLYMVWVRGNDIGEAFQDISIGSIIISFGAVLIMIFASMALRHAIARDINTHRRWALRLFMVVNGAWFLRIGYMLWTFLSSGSIDYDPKVFSSPIFPFITFGQYLVPLAVLELYFRAQDRAGARGKFAMAGGLFIVTILMGVGIFAATFGMWLPRL